MTWALLATLSAGLFAGAAVYVTGVEHPARLQRGVPFALEQFGPSYHRGAVMQASLAIGTLVLAVLDWSRRGDLLILAGGLVVGALVPFTLLVIFPTNRRLLDPALSRTAPEAAALLRRWGRLHAVRTIGGVAGFALMVLSLARLA
jgi:uncharacterized membrane protein